MKWWHLVPYWLLMLILLLTVATISATKRSQIRTECYRATQNIEACPKPAAWERWLNSVLSK